MLNINAKREKKTLPFHFILTPVKMLPSLWEFQPSFFLKSFWNFLKINWLSWKLLGRRTTGLPTNVVIVWVGGGEQSAKQCVKVLRKQRWVLGATLMKEGVRSLKNKHCLFQCRVANALLQNTEHCVSHSTHRQQILLHVILDCYKNVILPMINLSMSIIFY